MSVYVKITQLSQSFENPKRCSATLHTVMSHICADYVTYLNPSSFCNKVSLLPFHKLPITMPKNNKNPRFLFDTNFFQQSSGLLMFNV